MRIFAIIITIFAIGVFAIVIIKSIQFNQACGGNLKRAADANSVEIAKQELKTALDYMEVNSLTSGYTSVLWKTPDEDIGFWYKNLKTAYNELDSLPENSSSLEKSNMLIKLRETLLDHGKTDTITVPDGISRYPQNAFWGVMMWISGIVLLVSWAFITTIFESL